MFAEVPDLDVETVRLPRNWHAYVRSAVLNVVGVVRIARLAGREMLIKNGDSRHARIHQLEAEVAMLREELRLNGARMQRVLPHRRPQYTAVERMAILQLRAMRGWNKAETSRHFSNANQRSTPLRAWSEVIGLASNGRDGLLMFYRVRLPGELPCPFQQEMLDAMTLRVLPQRRAFKSAGRLQDVAPVPPLRLAALENFMATTPVAVFGADTGLVQP